MTNYFKEMLLNDINMYELSTEVTDARSEAKELLAFIKGYEYRLEHDYETYLEGYKNLTDDDYAEAQNAISKNHPIRRKVVMSFINKNFSSHCKDKYAISFRRPNRYAVRSNF